VASGFEALDPPVPSSPTTISLPPPAEIEDPQYATAPPPTLFGRLLGALLVFPAAVFGGLGKLIEGAAHLVAPKKDEPAVRISRTRIRD
jgi:hypothetical protein